MAGISSVTLNGLEVNQAPYYVLREGLSTLMSMVQMEPRLAEMAGRHPHLTGWTPQERSVPLTVGFQATTFADRETLYEALVAAIEPRYFPVTWTVNGTTRTMNVFCSGAVVSTWYFDAAISMVAPDPVPA